MAIAKITPIDIKQRNTFVDDVVTKSIDATDGAYFEMIEKDGKYAIEITNTDSSNAETVTIVAGNDPVWGDLPDLEITLEKSEVKWICLDGARFKQMTGAHKGRVLFEGSADVKLRVIRLP